MLPRALETQLDLLTQHRRRTLERVYKFLREAAFEHDFGNVEYEEGDFDQELGVKDLHTGKRKVEFKRRRLVLPPELLQRYGEMDFWQDNTGRGVSVIAAKQRKNRLGKNDGQENTRTLDQPADSICRLRRITRARYCGR